ncbi:MAG TPA: hypothetical protein VIY73_29330 [Polyangiaceae bacterium]
MRGSSHTTSFSGAMRRALSRSKHLARRLAADRCGANMVEYVILVGMVALIAFAGFKYFGNQTRAKIDQQGDALQSINGAAQ